MNIRGHEDVKHNHYCWEGHYDTLYADTGAAGRERERLYSGCHLRSRSPEGTGLPEMRETSGKVYDQVETNQLLIVRGVSQDVHRELAYVAVSSGCVSGN